MWLRRPGALEIGFLLADEGGSAGEEGAGPGGTGQVERRWAVVGKGLSVLGWGRSGADLPGVQDVPVGQGTDIGSIQGQDGDG